MKKPRAYIEYIETTDKLPAFDKVISFYLCVLCDLCGLKIRGLCGLDTFAREIIVMRITVLLPMSNRRS
jgi:hypothetical protein